MNLRKFLGLLRSLWMYYSVPFQRRQLKDFYRQFIGPEDVCIDVGAHVGNRLRVYRNLARVVVALEPQPVFFRFLKLLFGRDKKVILLQSAVGAKSGVAEMLVSERAPTVSSLSKWWVEAVHQRDETFSDVDWNTRIEVDVVTLDTLIQAYGLPSFIKIDVEGYESEVLKGLSHAVPALSFEYIHTTLEIPIECINRLCELGAYEFNYTIIEGACFELGSWVDREGIVEALHDLPPGATSGDVYARLKPRE